MEKQDTSVFPVYNEPEVRDSSEVWLIVYRSSGNFGEIFVSTNWNLSLALFVASPLDNSICDHTLFLNTSVQPDKSIILHYFKDNLITVLNVGISTI